MTYQNDPNTNRTDDQDTNWMAWLIGGVVVLAVILGVFLMTGPTGTDNTAANAPNPPRTTTTAPPPATTPPATTGSRAPTAPTAR